MSAKNENGNGHTNGELVLCPGSHEAINVVFLDQENLHRVPRKELDAHGGLCAACFEKVQRRHKAVRNGEVEKPATFETLRHFHADVEADHRGFTEDGEAEQTVGFNYNAIDGEPDSNIPTLGDALRAVLQWCWNDWNLTHRPESAFRKFVAASASINPDLLDNLTFKELGEMLGITRAALSKQSLEFQDRFGFHSTRSFSAAARDGCRKGQLEKTNSFSAAARDGCRKGQLEKTNEAKGHAPTPL